METIYVGGLVFAVKVGQKSGAIDNPLASIANRMKIAYAQT